MFNWLTSRVKAFGGRSTASLSLVSNWLANMLWTIEAKFLPLAQQAYGQNEVVYACIRLLSQSVPEAPLKAFDQDIKAGTKTPLPYDHDLAKIIRRPNSEMTEYEFWELTTIHMVIAGRSPWWKQRDNLGRVMGLWPLRPDRVGPIYSDTLTKGKEVIRGWVYQQPGSGELIEIDKEDMLVFHFPDPTGESGGIVEGFGPIQVLARQIATDNEATKFVGALLANYATPTTVIKLKKKISNEKEAEITKAKWRHEYGGANRGTPALLDADAEIQTLGFNLQQLEFPDIRTLAESRIAAACGVPAILAGLKVGLTEGNNRASVTEQRAYFAETTLSNYWRRYQDQYTEDMASEFGENIVCAFDTLGVHAMATHFQEKLAPVRVAYEKGATTRNEYRQAMGMSLLAPEKGDVFLIPTNMAEVAMDGELFQPNALGFGVAGQGEQGQGGSNDTNDGNSSGNKPESRRPRTGGENKPVAMEPSRGPRNEQKKAVALKEADFDYQIEAEEKLTAIIAAILAEYRPKAVASIRNRETFDYLVLGNDLKNSLEPFLIRVATEQVLREAQEMTIGIDPVEANLAAYRWADEYIAGLVAGLLETTRAVIDNAIARANNAPGMTDEQLEELLVAAFAAYRAEAISSTEITRALVVGNAIYNEYLAKRGVRTVRIYHTARDEKVCLSVCAPSDGRREGEAGFALPPRHVSCRCWLETRMAS